MQEQDHPLLSARNFWFASLYFTVIGLLGSLLSEVLNAQGVPAGIASLAIAVLCAAGGYVLSAHFRRVWRRWWAQRRGFITILENNQVLRARGMIAFVSMGQGRSSALQAALYHADGGALEHIWLVTAPDAVPDAEWVTSQIREAHPGIHIHAIESLEDVNSITAAKGLIEYLRRYAIRECNIPEPDLICDFTGLTKHASAGMILACAPREARLQYMHATRKLADGRADPAAGSVPREVDIRYVVVEQD